MEDPVKVQDKIRELREETGQTWVQLTGFVALMGVSELTHNNTKFQDKIGYPIKAFINTDTGEVKIFKGKIFLE